MILGLPVPVFTFIHVLISLAAIFSGGVVLAAMLKSRHLPA